MSQGQANWYDERLRDSARALVAVLGLWFLGFVLGCGATSTHAPDRMFAHIVFDGAPEGTLVYVDDRPVARLSAGSPPVRVEAGARRVRLEAPGFLVERMDVDAKRGELYGVEVSMWPCFPSVDPDCSPPEADDLR